MKWRQRNCICNRVYNIVLRGVELHSTFACDDFHYTQFHSMLLGFLLLLCDFLRLHTSKVRTSKQINYTCKRATRLQRQNVVSAFVCVSHGKIYKINIWIKKPAQIVWCAHSQKICISNALGGEREREKATDLYGILVTINGFCLLKSQKSCKPNWKELNVTITQVNNLNRPDKRFMLLVKRIFHRPFHGTRQPRCAEKHEHISN